MNKIYYLMIVIGITFLLCINAVSASQNGEDIKILLLPENQKSSNITVKLIVSVPLSEQYNITLLDYKTGKTIKSFFLTNTSQQTEISNGTYIIFVENKNGTEEVLLDNNGTGYKVGDTVIIQYCRPTLVTCRLEDQFYLDIPWRVEPGKNIPVFGVIDTPTKLWNVRIYDTKHTGDTSDDIELDKKEFSPSLSITSLDLPYTFDFSVDPSSLTLINGKASIRIAFRVDAIIDYDNDEGPLDFLISTSNLPKLSKWYMGDTHYHSEYTYNKVEFGAPIETISTSSKAIGLDWVTITDHSFDLDSSRWSNLGVDCNSISDSEFKCIRGEEISCYLPGTINTICLGCCQYSHYLAYGINSYILGGECEDGTGSDYTPAEVVSMVNDQGGFGYVAHPLFDDPFRDPWRDQDYSLDFIGLEIWNGVGNIADLESGLGEWKDLLKNGRKVFIVGGSDAHGDLNAGYGKVRTYVYTETFTEEGILDALCNGHSIMTDGPLVVFEINGEVIGNNVSLTSGTNATLHIQWNSTQEFGNITTILVKKGVINGTEETNVTILTPSSTGKDPLCDEHELMLSANESCYYRVEAYSNITNGEQYRCYTNPIWVEVVNDITLPEVTITYPQNGSVIVVSDITVTGYATDDVGIVTMCYEHGWEGRSIGGCGPEDNATVPINWTIELREGLNTIKVTAYDAADNSGNASVIVTGIKRRFDTGNGTYPSIMGNHTGTITPSCNITVSKLYTYPCAGTGGHTDYAAIFYSNGTKIADAHWNSYSGDWHNITFSNSFTLYANHTYNYTIKTGSYPQIIHESPFNATGGVITCEEFVDINGKRHESWIPAIKLFGLTEQVL